MLKTIKNRQGFTLMEMVIALGISAIVLAGLGKVFISQQKMRASQNQVIEMHQNLRSAMLLLTEEIQRAGYDPTGEYAGQTGFTKIHAGTDNDDDSGQMEFSYYDEKKHGLHKAVIRLFDSGNDPGNTKDEIQMKPGGQSIADNIDSMTFAFFDKNGQETQVPENVRSVAIFLTARNDETKIQPPSPRPFPPPYPVKTWETDI